MSQVISETFSELFGIDYLTEFRNVLSVTQGNVIGEVPLYCYRIMNDLNTWVLPNDLNILCPRFDISKHSIIVTLWRVYLTKIGYTEYNIQLDDDIDQLIFKNNISSIIIIFSKIPLYKYISLMELSCMQVWWCGEKAISMTDRESINQNIGYVINRTPCLKEKIDIYRQYGFTIFEQKPQLVVIE